MDGSVLVRCQLAVALHWFVLDFEEIFGNLVIELDKQCGNFESPAIIVPPSTPLSGVFEVAATDRSNSLPRRGRTNVSLAVETPNVKRSNSVVLSNGGIYMIVAVLICFQMETLQHQIYYN